MQPNLSRSRAILIGNSTYREDSGIPELRAALPSVRAMAELLCGELCGWPESQVDVLVDVANRADLARRITRVVRDAEDTVLLYYVGHGLRTSKGKLALALGDSDSEPALLPHTAILYEDIADILRECVASTKVVILDCCHAELANRANSMFQSTDLIDAYPVDGLYFIGASKMHERAKAPLGEALTYFTENFIATVREGVHDHCEYLSLEQIFVGLYQRMTRRGLPKPVESGIRGARRYPFARNTGHIRARRSEAVEIDSHKFIPLYIGVQEAEAQVQPSREQRADRWSPIAAFPVDWEGGQCSVSIFDFGVAVFHVVERIPAETVTEAALWRYRTYEENLPQAAELADRLFPGRARDAQPEYVLSVYHVLRRAETEQETEVLLNLLCTPSVLVDRNDPSDFRALGSEIEEGFFDSDFRAPDSVAFGLPRVSKGYASWSGVSYLSIAQERALRIEEIVECELLIQALWCYSSRIHAAVEDGRNPAVDDRYGWRFMRRAEIRVTSARPTETTAHRAMRDAVVVTSGLQERLRAAQEVLRELAQ